MGQARRKLLGSKDKKRLRFIHLLKLVSNYADGQIVKFLKHRKLYVKGERK